MRYPAKGTIFAPSAACVSVSGVRLSVSVEAACDIERGLQGNCWAEPSIWQTRSALGRPLSVCQLPSNDRADLPDIRSRSSDNPFQNLPQNQGPGLVVFHVNHRIRFDKNQREPRIIRSTIPRAPFISEPRFPVGLVQVVDPLSISHNTRDATH